MLKWTSFNPKFAIIIGIIENISMMFTMIYLQLPLKYILFFVFMCFILKVIPYYMIRKEPIRRKDIWFTVFLGIIYLIWCELNHFDFLKVDTDLSSKKFDLPGMVLLDSILKMVSKSGR